MSHILPHKTSKMFYIIIAIASITIILLGYKLSEKDNIIKEKITQIESYQQVIAKTDEINDELKIQQAKLIKELTYQWCLSKANSYIPEKELRDIVDIAFKYDRWKLILCIISVESRFDRYAKSPRGADGLMQIMYSVWKTEFQLPSERSLFDIENNIKYGNAVITTYLEGTDINDALYKYVGKDKPREYEKKVLLKYAELSIFIKEGLKKDGNDIKHIDG